MSQLYSGKCLSLIGTAHIQEYLFRSNRLKENAGASELARAALEEWNGLPCTIFVGGGNAALLFDSQVEAQERIWQWSRAWLSRAPGLRFTVAHHTIESSLRQAWREAQVKLRECEERPPSGYELGALPVVRTCQSTGRAASGQEGPQRGAAWLSPEALAKRREAAEATERLQRDYKKELRGWYQFPKEFSDLGQREGASHIAIVHADGNGIGCLFAELGKNPPLDGKDFLDRLRDLSAAVTRLARTAFAATVADLVEIHSELRDREGWIRLPMATEGPPFLPLRPLVDSGDDLTFVCHGKLGLALAARYLDHFERGSMECLAGFGEPGQRWTACAGVLIMPDKFPFARGYRLAADLTRRAKTARIKDITNEAPDACWMDFHVQHEGAAGSLEKVRREQYRNAQGTLLSRPYRLSRAEDDARSWYRFQGLWEHFYNISRSRAKALLEALVRGQTSADETVKAFEAAGVALPEILQSRSEYWDPLELLDYYRDPWLERRQANAAA